MDQLEIATAIDAGRGSRREGKTDDEAGTVCVCVVRMPNPSGVASHWNTICHYSLSEVFFAGGRIMATTAGLLMIRWYTHEVPFCLFCFWLFTLSYILKALLRSIMNSNVYCRKHLRFCFLFKLEPNLQTPCKEDTGTELGHNWTRKEKKIAWGSTSVPVKVSFCTWLLRLKCHIIDRIRS